MLWPLLLMAAIIAISLIWQRQPRRAALIAVVVTSLVLGYEYYHLTKGY
jgi:uncharacterized MnhB-related membrane protein